MCCAINLVVSVLILRLQQSFDKLRMAASCHVEQCHTELVEVLSKHRQDAGKKENAPSITQPFYLKSPFKKPIP